MLGQSGKRHMSVAVVCRGNCRHHTAFSPAVCGVFYYTSNITRKKDGVNNLKGVVTNL